MNLRLFSFWSRNDLPEEVGEAPRLELEAGVDRGGYRHKADVQLFAGGAHCFRGSPLYAGGVHYSRGSPDLPTKSYAFWFQFV